VDEAGAGGVPIEVVGPLSGQGAVAEGILRALPAWFGIESAIIEYADAAARLPTFVVREGAAAVGFDTLKPTSPAAVELHVKTLAPSDPDPGYAATRRFYEATGFVPLEELPQVWGPENPCLLMVRVL
jgi:hypothetical protein